MRRINRLLKDSTFQSYLEKNRAYETERIYCRHDLPHALDAARISYILNLEEHTGLDQEILYAAALVHDIGRWKEYEDGIPHEEAGVQLAEGLLEKAGFTDAEVASVLEAIGCHRNGGGTSTLSGLLYRADKLSRNCVTCTVLGSCKHFQNGELPVLNY